MKRTLIPVCFLFLSACSGFFRSDRGKLGEECFENGTCRDGLVCSDGFCISVLDTADEDDDTGYSMSDNDTDTHDDFVEYQDTGDLDDTDTADDIDDEAVFDNDKTDTDRAENPDINDDDSLNPDDNIPVDTDNLITDADDLNDADADSGSPADDGSNRIVIIAHTSGSLRSLYLVTKRGGNVVKLMAFPYDKAVNDAEFPACLSPSGDKLAILNKEVSPEKFEIWKITGTPEKTGEVDFSGLLYPYNYISKCDFISETRLVIGYMVKDETSVCTNLNRAALSLWDIENSTAELLSSEKMGCAAAETFVSVASRESVLASFWPGNYVGQTFIGELSFGDDEISSWGNQTAIACSGSDGHTQEGPSVSDSGNKIAFVYNRASGYDGIKDIILCSRDSSVRSVIVQCPDMDSQWIGGTQHPFISEEKVLLSCDRASAYEVDISGTLPVDIENCITSESCIKWDLSEISADLEVRSLNFIDSAPWNGSLLPELNDFNQCVDGYSCASSGWKTLFCGADAVETCQSGTVCSAWDGSCCNVTEDTSGGHGAIICSKNNTVVKGVQGSAPLRLYGGKIKIDDSRCGSRLLKQVQYCLTLERLDKTWCYGGMTISEDNYAEFSVPAAGLKLDEDLLDGDVLVPSLKNIRFDGLDSLITLEISASYTVSDESCGVTMSDITSGNGDLSGNYCTIPINGTVNLSGGFSVKLLFCFLDSLGNVTSALDKTASSTYAFTEYKTCSTGMSCADSEAELLVVAGVSFSTDRTEECESFLAGTMSQENIFASKRITLPACQSKCSICQ